MAEFHPKPRSPSAGTLLGFGHFEVLKGISQGCRVREPGWDLDQLPKKICVWGKLSLRFRILKLHLHWIMEEKLKFSFGQCLISVCLCHGWGGLGVAQEDLNQLRGNLGNSASGSAHPWRKQTKAVGGGKSGWKIIIDVFKRLRIVALALP